MRNRLLLVDGDPRSLRVLDVSLRSAGFDVDTAMSGSDAWAMLESAVPDLIIADTDLGGIDGFELCARLRRNPIGANIPFVFLAADKALDQKIRALEAGANDYLVKPAYVKEVLARVRALLQRRDRERLASAQDGTAGQGGQGDQGGQRGITGPDGKPVPDHFSGSIADITVVDLVQVVEGNGRSGIVHLRGANGAPASIYFRHGKVVDAEVGRLSGIDALSRLFSWPDGTFELEWKSIRRKDAIERASAELVIEGMQRLDDWNRLLGQLPDVNAVFEVDYRLLAERLAEIPDEVNSILRLCDGVRTVMQVVEDCAIPDIDALTAMIKLREEGIVYDLSGGRVPERQADSARLGGWLGTASSSFPSGSEGHAATGRMGIGSGPVQQSFADRLQGEAEAEAQARGDGGHPGTEAAAPSVDVEREGGPPRRRTAPGLGQRSPEGASAAHAIPETRSGPTEDNVIKFPAPGDARSGGSGSTRFGSALPSDDRTPVLPAAKEPETEAAPVAAPVSAGPTSMGSSSQAPGSAMPSPLAGLTLPLGFAGETALARGDTSTSEAAPAMEATPAAPAPASVSDTQRGFGRPVATEASGDLGVPVPTSDKSSGRSGQSDSVVAPTDRSARRMAPQLGDTTVRVSFSDSEISRGDALDELGLPSRLRGLWFLAGALVVGTLAAVGVHQFRSHKARSQAPQGPSAKEQVERAQAPAVAPGRGPVVISSTAPVPAGVLPGTPPAGWPSKRTGVGVDGQPASAPSAPGSPTTDRATASSRQDGLPKAPANSTPVRADPVTSPQIAGEPSPSAGTAARGAAERVGPAVVAARPAGEVARGATERASPAGAAVVVTGAAGEAARGAAERVGPAVVSARPVAEATTPPAVAGARLSKGPALPAARITPPAATDPARQLADCRTAFSHNRMREALTACTAAVTTSPHSAEALTMLAHTELNRGRLARATELAEKAVAIDPNLADAYVIIGGVHQDSGQNREAKAAYRRYLQLAPKGRYADELRSIVNSL